MNEAGRDYKNRLVSFILLVLIVVGLALMFGGYWGTFPTVKNNNEYVSVYEGTNPPKEMLVDSHYVWGRYQIERNGQWHYFIVRKPITPVVPVSPVHHAKG